MTKGPQKPPKGAPPVDGLERRSPEVLDRRAKPRGGRRATDAFKRLADFAYKLLTEPPR
jgi:hypothetical protein